MESIQGPDYIYFCPNFEGKKWIVSGSAVICNKPWEIPKSHGIRSELQC